QHAGARQLPERGRQEVLLAPDPIEIAEPVGKAITLPDERQRLGALDNRHTGWQVDAGVGLFGRGAEVDRNAAYRIAYAVEAEQVDLDEVIDGQAGEVGHRFHSEPGAGGRTAVCAVDAGGIGRVDLVHPVPGNRDVGIPGNRDDGGLSAVSRHVQHHHCVGVQAAAVAGRAQLGQLGVGRRLAVVVSDNQDVLILAVDVLLRLAHSADCVDAAYVLFEPAPGPPGPPAGHEHG